MRTIFLVLGAFVYIQLASDAPALVESDPILESMSTDMQVITDIIDSQISSETTVDGEITTPIPTDDQPIPPKTKSDILFSRRTLKEQKKFNILAILALNDIFSKPDPIGNGQLTAMSCAVSHINASESILPGMELTLLAADNFAVSIVAVNQATRMVPSAIAISERPEIRDGVLGVSELFGPTFAATTAQLDIQSYTLVDYFQATSMPIMQAIGAVDATQEFQQNLPVYFQMWPSIRQQMSAIMDLMVQFKWQFLAPIFSASEYGLSVGQIMFEEASKRDITLVCTAVTIRNANFNIEEYSSCLSGIGVNAIALFMEKSDCVGVLSQIQAIPDNANVFGFLSERCTLEVSRPGYAAYNIAGQPIEGDLPTAYTRFPNRISFPPEFLQGFFGFYPTSGNLVPVTQCMTGPLGPNQGPFNRSLYASTFQALFRCMPLDSEGNYADPSIVVTETLPVCPENIYERSSMCVCTGKEQITQRTLETMDPSLNYAWDTVVTISTALDYILNKCDQLKGRDFCSGEYFSSRDIIDAITQIKVIGLTGPISFAATKPYREDVTIDIYQFDTDVNLDKVGSWNSLTGITLDESMLSFKNNEVPYAIQPETTTIDGDGEVPIIFFVVAILGCVTTCFMALVFCIGANTYTAQYLRLPFVLTLLTGATLIFISEIVWALGQNTGICVLKSIMIFLGAGFIVGALLGKAQRIVRVALADGSTVTKYGDINHTMEFFPFALAVIIGLGANIVIMTAFLILGDGPKAFISNTVNNPYYFYVTCAPGYNLDYGLYQSITFLAVNGFLVVCVLMAMLVVTDQYCPFMQQITLLFTAAGILTVGVVAIPMYYTITIGSNSSVNQFTVRSVATMIIAFGVIVVMLGAPWMEILREIWYGKKVQCEHVWDNYNQTEDANFPVMFVSETVLALEKDQKV